MHTMYDQLYVVLPPVYASQVRFLFAMKTMVKKIEYLPTYVYSMETTGDSSIGGNQGHGDFLHLIKDSQYQKPIIW